MTHSKKKIRNTVLLAVGAVLAAAVGFCIVPVTSFLSGRSQPMDETVLSAQANTTAEQEVVTLTDDQIDQLIRGETTLEELVAVSGTSGASDSATVNSEGAADAAAPSVLVDSAASAETDAAASDSESGAASGSASAAASSSSTASSSGTQASGGTDAAAAEGYEAEVKALIQQLYAVKATAESGLNSAISSAKAEYHALPADQQTQAKKVSICFSKAGQLSALQASCDSQVNSIVSQMRTVLKENGQSTALADQAMSSYKSQKSAMYSSLMSQLYR